MTKAYLVIIMQHNGTPFPNVRNVGIYSSNALGLTSAGPDFFYVDAFQSSGVSYHEAHKNLVAYIMHHPMFSWARPWVDTSEEAHAAKYYWQIMTRR